ncbi:MAG TPA: T9SS type A sorting domain-containing protein, partial [Saprospiraceae bacterium]|nr:T9SS type A sorting domain-containing protein [Saprospiraceae bacterium]
VYMVSGTNEAFNASAWTLSPNPANATLAIQNRSETAVQASFRIYSAAGRLVFARPETRLAPSGLWEVPVNNWPEGLYLLHIGTSQGTTVRKFTVQR